jgi:hypothetical protein
MLVESVATKSARRCAHRQRIKGLSARTVQVIENSGPNSRGIDRIKPCALLRSLSCCGAGAKSGYVPVLHLSAFRAYLALGDRAGFHGVLSRNI